MEQKPKKPGDNFFGDLKISVTGIFKDLNKTLKDDAKRQTLSLKTLIGAATKKAIPKLSWGSDDFHGTYKKPEKTKTNDTQPNQQSTTNIDMSVIVATISESTNTIDTTLQSIRTDINEHSKKSIELLTKLVDLFSAEDKTVTTEKNTTVNMSMTGNMNKFKDFVGGLTEKTIENFKSFVDNVKRLSEIDVDKLLKINDSLIKLEETKNKGKMSPLQQMAVGIGILVLSLLAINFLDFGQMLKLVAFIGLLGVVLAGVKKMDVGASMFYFASGIGMMTISMALMSLVEWESGAKMLLFIGLLGLIFKKFNFDHAKDNPLWQFAAGIGILTLSLIAMTAVEWTSIFKMLLFIGGLAIVLNFFPAENPGLGMLLFAAGLGLMVLAMYAMKDVPLAALGITLVFLGALGLILKLYNPATTYAMLMLAGGLLAIAGAFWVLSKIDVSGEKMAIFAATIVGLSLAMALIGAPFIAPFVMTGALTFAAMSGSLLLGALAVAAISNLTIDSTKIKAFGSAIWDLSVALTLAMPMLVIGAVAAVMLIPIAVAALTAAGSLKLISMLEIKQENLTKFLSSMKVLVEGIDNFGLLQLTKVAAKSVLIIPTVLALTAAATAIRIISEMEINGSKITAFGEIMNTFVTSIATSIAANVDKLKEMEPGLQALSQLINIGGQLAKVIQAFSSMTYNEYGVKDGKIVLTGVRKITDDDIKMVGTNIGKLIQGLLAPLAIISSDDKTWDFGNGVKMANPFAGGWFSDNDSGTERLTKLGNAFLPLSEVMKNLSGIEMSDGSNATLAVKQLVGIVNQLNEVAELNDSFLSSTDSVVRFMDTLSDQNKWKIINENLDKVSKSFKDITTNINNLNVDKAMALERNLKLMTDKNSAESLEKVVDSLAELVGMMRETVDKVTAAKAPVLVQQTSVREEKTEKIQQQAKEAKEKESMLGAAMSNIAASIEQVNIKLGNKLKVVLVDGSTANKL